VNAQRQTALGAGSDAQEEETGSGFQEEAWKLNAVQLISVGGFGAKCRN